jgi:hypothetical protein
VFTFCEHNILHYLLIQNQGQYDLDIISSTGQNASHIKRHPQEARFIVLMYAWKQCSKTSTTEVKFHDGPSEHLKMVQTATLAGQERL